MLSVYNEEDIEQLRRRYGLQPHRIKLFLRSFFKKSADVECALKQLPESIRSLFLQSMQFKFLKLEHWYDSNVDRATKLLFKTQDHCWVESVILRPKTGRISLCISSQIGCGCKCKFCATGTMGFVRNLTKAEILDQIILAKRFIQKEERNIRNIVFMGMGEPLQNYENVSESIELLCSPRFFNYSPGRIMVSTVGISSAMVRFSEQFPNIRLALSLHSARQEIREKIIPIAKTQRLKELHRTLKVITTRNPIMIEYLMIKGINDSDKDLNALICYLKEIYVHINLIPYNKVQGISLQGSSFDRRQFFANKLKEAGFTTTLRHSFGSDISAACGQLACERRN